MKDKSTWMIPQILKKIQILNKFLIFIYVKNLKLQNKRTQLTCWQDPPCMKSKLKLTSISSRSSLFLRRMLDSSSLSSRDKSSGTETGSSKQWSTFTAFPNRNVHTENQLEGFSVLLLLHSVQLQQQQHFQIREFTLINYRKRGES